MPQSNHSVPKQLAWNTSAQIVARGISALTTLLMTIFIARRFGANGYGDFVKITTYIAFFYLLADFGFNAVYLQRTPLSAGSDKNIHDSPWEDLLGLRIFVGCLLVVIAGASAFILPRGAGGGYTHFVQLGILLFAPSILFQAMITSANALFQKYLRYDLSTIAVMIGSFVSLVLVILVTQGIIPGNTILYSTTALLVGAAVTALISLYLTRRLQITWYSSVSWVRIRSLFIESLPLGVTLLFNLVYFRIDSVILTITRSTAEVGIYGLAYKVFELPLVLPTFFMNALYPMMLGITQNKSGDQQSLRDVILKSGTFLFFTSIVVFIIVWAGAPVVGFIKNDFVPAIAVLRILIIGLPFFFLSSLTMWTLIAYKRQKTLAAIYGISMVLNVVLNALFIPRYGYVAAAWITVISEGFVLLVSGIAVIPLLHKEK